MTDLKQQIESIVHLVGCQTYTVGCNEPTKSDKGLEEVERLEKITTGELLDLFKKLCGEIIGLDQPLPVDDRDWDCVKHQNQLRTQQRNNLNKLGDIL